MQVQILDDMVYPSFGDIGDPLPAHLEAVPVDRLRSLDGELVDAASITTFYIAAHGMKHAVPADGRQALACAWDAVLIKAADGWRVVTDDDSLASAKAVRISGLAGDCAAAIVGGFSSPALGPAHLYPSKVTDQINLMGSVTGSLLPGLEPDWSTPFWCRDDAGVWMMRPHSAAQIQAAGADGKAHILACQMMLDQLAAEVETATTVEAVAAIVWPDTGG